MDPDLDTVLALARSSSRIVAEIDRPLGSWHGIGLRDLALLLELQASPDHRLARSDLADRLGVSTSTVGRQLGPLERIGVVGRERHPTDARLGLAVLTAAGDTLATDAAVTAGDAADRVLRERWSDQDRRTLRELLGLIA